MIYRHNHIKKMIDVRIYDSKNDTLKIFDWGQLIAQGMRGSLSRCEIRYDAIARIAIVLESSCRAT